MDSNVVSFVKSEIKKHQDEIASLEKMLNVYLGREVYQPAAASQTQELNEITSEKPTLKSRILAIIKGTYGIKITSQEILHALTFDEPDKDVKALRKRVYNTLLIMSDSNEIKVDKSGDHNLYWIEE